MAKSFTYTELKEYFRRYRSHLSDHIKIARGTRTGKYYIIGSDDRDYNTSFVLTVQDFMNTNSEPEALERML
jgi:hypothetical protein